MNQVWMQTRDNRWANGKLLWHGGLMAFQRSIDGALIAVDNDLSNWRDEVKRRVELDNSMPGRLARYAAARGDERIEFVYSFKEDGKDIYDWPLKQKDVLEYASSNNAAFCFSRQGRFQELKWALNLAKEAAEGGDQYAAEFVRNKENNLSCELAHCSPRFGGE